MCCEQVSAHMLLRVKEFFYIINEKTTYGTLVKQEQDYLYWTFLPKNTQKGMAYIATVETLKTKEDGGPGVLVYIICFDKYHLPDQHSLGLHVAKGKPYFGDGTSEDVVSEFSPFQMVVKGNQAADGSRPSLVFKIATPREGDFAPFRIESYTQ